MFAFSGGVLHLNVVVLVVALDDDGRHAEVGDHAVQALLGGVVEAAVAELARHDQRDGQALGLAVGVGAGGWSIFLLPQAARLSTITAHSSNRE